MSQLAVERFHHAVEHHAVFLENIGISTERNYVVPAIKGEGVDDKRVGIGEDIRELIFHANGVLCIVIGIETQREVAIGRCTEQHFIRTSNHEGALPLRAHGLMDIVLIMSFVACRSHYYSSRTGHLPQHLIV